MPKQVCAQCLLHIERIPGKSGSFLCSKCSRLFHQSCLVFDAPFSLGACPRCAQCVALAASVPQPLPPVAASGPLGFRLPIAAACLIPPSDLSVPLRASGVRELSRSPTSAGSSAPDGICDQALGPGAVLPCASDTALASDVSSCPGSITTGKRPRSSPPEGLVQTAKQARGTVSPQVPMNTINTSALPASMPTDAPEWARALLSAITAHREESARQLSHIQASIDGLSSRVAALEGSLRETRAELQTVKTEITDVHQNFGAFSTAHGLRDSHELRFSGIPVECLTDVGQAREAICCILRAVGCEDAISSIFRVRLWDAPAAGSAGTARTCNAAAASFGSDVAKDAVLTAASHLRNHSAQSIFGRGGDSKVYIGQVLPSPVHRLFLEALKVSRSLHYLRPYVQLSTVYMRASLSSPPIPIYTSADLRQLPTNAPSGAPSNRT